MMLDRLSKLGARERLGLIFAGLVLLGLLVDRLVVQSVLDRSRELSAEIAVQSLEAAYNRGVLQGEMTVREEYERLIGLMDEVESEAAAIDRMKDQIDRIAGKAEVSLNSWEERRPEKHGLYDEHFVAVRQFESTMSGLLQFLYDIRMEAGLLRVDELQIAPVKDSDMMRGTMLITKVVRTDGDRSLREPGGGDGDQ